MCACGEVLESHRTKTVHTQTVKSGFGNTHLCKWLDIRISRKVVDEMSRKDVLTLTAMIFWYTRVGDITKAALLFEAMPDRDAAARSD